MKRRCYCSIYKCQYFVSAINSVSYYEKAVKAEDFFLVDHAYFSLGRVNEAKGNYDAAVEAYEKIGDLHPASKWAPLAKDRIIAIKANSSETK